MAYSTSEVDYLKQCSNCGKAGNSSDACRAKKRIRQVLHLSKGMINANVARIASVPVMWRRIVGRSMAVRMVLKLRRQRNMYLLQLPSRQLILQFLGPVPAIIVARKGIWREIVLKNLPRFPSCTATAKKPHSIVFPVPLRPLIFGHRLDLDEFATFCGTSIPRRWS